MTFLIRKAGEGSSPHPEGSLEIIPESMEEAYQLGLLVEELHQNNSEAVRGSRDMIRILIPLTERKELLTRVAVASRLSRNALLEKELDDNGKVLQKLQNERDEAINQRDANEKALKDVLSDTLYYIRKERVEQLELELSKVKAQRDKTHAAITQVLDHGFTEESRAKFCGIYAEIRDSKLEELQAQSGVEVSDQTTPAGTHPALVITGVRRAMGHIQNGSSGAVKFMQDEATGVYHFLYGNGHLWSESFSKLLDQVAKIEEQE